MGFGFERGFPRSSTGRFFSPPLPRRILKGEELKTYETRQPELVFRSGSLAFLRSPRGSFPFSKVRLRGPEFFPDIEVCAGMCTALPPLLSILRLLFFPEGLSESEKAELSN